jgi:hypothetical protein
MPKQIASDATPPTVSAKWGTEKTKIEGP